MDLEEFHDRVAQRIHENGYRSVLNLVRLVDHDTLVEEYGDSFGYSEEEEEIPTIEPPIKEELAGILYKVGDDCRLCDDGKYHERTLMDSFSGRYTCNKCGDLVYHDRRY